MIGLNVTRQVLADPARRAAIRSIGRASATHVADMLDHYSEAEAVYTGLPSGAMHDPVAVVALAEPGIVAFEPMHVAVELTGSLTAGMTVCDGRRLGPDLRRIRTDRPVAEGGHRTRRSPWPSTPSASGRASWRSSRPIPERSAGEPAVRGRQGPMQAPPPRCARWTHRASAPSHRRTAGRRRRRGPVADRLAAGGWRILGRNVHVGRRELDIVAVDPGPPAWLGHHRGPLAPSARLRPAGGGPSITARGRASTRPPMRCSDGTTSCISRCASTSIVVEPSPRGRGAARPAPPGGVLEVGAEATPAGRRAYTSPGRRSRQGSRRRSSRRPSWPGSRRAWRP